MSKYGVVSVIYGRGAETYLANLCKQQGSICEDFKLLVVDHGGHDFAPEDFETFGVEYVRRDNLGFSAGVNFGSRRLFKECDFVYVLNPDLKFDINELKNINELARTDFSVLSVKENGKSESIYHYSYLTGSVHKEKHIFTFPFFNGAAFLWSKEVFELTSGFDERYFLYYEDVDYALKIRRRNIYIQVIETTSFEHEVGGSRSGETKLMIEQISAASALLFTRKWFFWNPILWARYLMKLAMAPMRY